MKVLSDVLYLYIFVFSIFFIYLLVKSFVSNKFSILKKTDNVSNKKNLCLIIYTHNNEQKLRRMLECLKRQDYPSENTSIFVILDNCDDNSEKINFAQNVQKFIVKNQGRIGKKQAISILVEKIREYSVIDYFVFLDINRYIENDFLSSVNASLNYNDIVSGSTILFGENLTLRQKIKSAYQKYKMNFLEKARAIANLYTIIDSDVCAIKRTLVDEVGLPNFENLESDLEYSLDIAKNGFNFSFNPNVKTYCEAHDFKIRIPRLSRRMNLFFYNCLNLFSINTKYAEFVIFQLCPNIVFLLMAFVLLTILPLDSCFFASFSVVITLICMLVISFALSLMKTRMKAREISCLLLYPIYSFFHVVKHFFLWRFIKNCFCKNAAIDMPVEKFEVDVEVTDGRASAPCKLILINEYGMVKVKFLFKNKEIVTKTHLRMYDAIEELVKKLEEYGFTIKICQACANFTSYHDGSTNLIKGFCKGQFQVSEESAVPVVIWNTCRGFCPRVIVKNVRGLE